MALAHTGRWCTELVKGCLKPAQLTQAGIHCSRVPRLFRYSDGAFYEGEWKQGCRHGNGKYTKANNDVYHGEWVNDSVDGKGTLRTVNGEVYIGLWSDSKRNGRGRCEYKDGSVYDGEWVEDSREGKGRSGCTCCCRAVRILS
jgi:hypothetical protein